MNVSRHVPLLVVLFTVVVFAPTGTPRAQMGAEERLDKLEQTINLVVPRLQHAQREMRQDILVLQRAADTRKLEPRVQYLEDIQTATNQKIFESVAPSIPGTYNFYMQNCDGVFVLAKDGTLSATGMGMFFGSNRRIQRKGTWSIADHTLTLEFDAHAGKDKLVFGKLQAIKPMKFVGLRGNEKIFITATEQRK